MVVEMNHPENEDYIEENNTEDIELDPSIQESLKQALEGEEFRQIKDRTEYTIQEAWIMADNPTVYDSEKKIRDQINKVAADDLEFRFMLRVVNRERAKRGLAEVMKNEEID